MSTQKNESIETLIEARFKNHRGGDRVYLREWRPNSVSSGRIVLIEDGTYTLKYWGEYHKVQSSEYKMLGLITEVMHRLESIVWETKVIIQFGYQNMREGQDQMIPTGHWSVYCLDTEEMVYGDRDKILSEQIPGPDFWISVLVF